jgi:hypothetical protein
LAVFQGASEAPISESYGSSAGPGPEGCDENGLAAALLVGHVSVQICSLLPPVRLGPPCRRAILIATKYLAFRGQDTTSNPTLSEGGWPIDFSQLPAVPADQRECSGDNNPREHEKRKVTLGVLGRCCGNQPREGRHENPQSHTGENSAARMRKCRPWTTLQPDCAGCRQSHAKPRPSQRSQRVGWPMPTGKQDGCGKCCTHAACSDSKPRSPAGRRDQEQAQGKRSADGCVSAWVGTGLKVCLEQAVMGHQHSPGEVLFENLSA